MKTAIITGASSGLGREYASQLAAAFPDIERVYLIARRKSLLEELAASISVPAETIALDLCKDEDLAALSDKLSSEKPEVALLVNCAGCGYLSNVEDTELARLTRMTDLNIRALTAVTRLCLPYMPARSHIINVSSIASFCPNARMTVYSSTKAYVSSFSLGLREELRPKRISVTAICSGPMATEFLDIGGIKGNSKMFSTLPYCDPKKVVSGSYKAAKHDSAFHTPKSFYKLYRFLAKVIPSTVMVKFTKT